MNVRIACYDWNGQNISNRSEADAEVFVPSIKRWQGEILRETKEAVWIRIGETIISIRTEDILDALREGGVKHATYESV